MSNRPDQSPTAATLGIRMLACAGAMLLMTAAGLWLSPAHALQFTPTDEEWAKWPDYCRARYVVSGKGRSSGRETEIPPAEVAAWETKMGTDAWYGLHHHCAALAYLQRALASPPGMEREGLFKSAVRNHNYELKNLPPQHFLYPQVMVSLAATFAAWGKRDRALSTLDTAIAAQPTASMPYLVKARMYRDAGQMAKYREILLDADEATAGQSAEIKYAIGLAYYKSNEYKSAQKYAREAYSLGYPLPWLRDELRRKGLNVDALPPGGQP